jgi:hypothetical protein
MEMGIVVTAFYLFGMLGLVIFNETLKEPTSNRSVKTLPKAERTVSKAHPHKKAA